MPGELLTRWTIRLALAACVACWAVELLSRRRGGTGQAVARALWTAGCVGLWIHVACAFAFYHHGSHATAVEHTARQTREVAGLDWGGGIWINYLLMLLWAADVGWWWGGPQSFAARPRWLTRAWLAFFAFIAFNATVVFAEGFSRYAGIGAIVFLTALAMARRPNRVTTL